MEKAKDLKHQRAETLAHLFLQDLGASVWTAHEEIGPLDSIAVYLTVDKKLCLFGVEVKATEQAPDREFRFQGRPETIHALRHSNVPVLFLVADVKHNELYYGWASDIRVETVSSKRRPMVSCVLLVSSAKEGKKELLEALSSQPDSSEHVAVD